MGNHIHLQTTNTNNSNSRGDGPIGQVGYDQRDRMPPSYPPSGQYGGGIGFGDYGGYGQGRYNDYPALPPPSRNPGYGGGGYGGYGGGGYGGGYGEGYGGGYGYGGGQRPPIAYGGGGGQISQQQFRQSYGNGLSDREVEELCRIFNEMSGADRELDFDEFIQVLSRLNPGMPSNVVRTVAQRSFAASDRNGNGKLCFQEFLCAYKLTRSRDLSSNVNYCLQDLQQYHANPGYLTQQEAYSYYNYLCEFHGRPRELNPEVIYVIFRETNRISYNDFVDRCVPHFERFLYSSFKRGFF